MKQLGIFDDYPNTPGYQDRDTSRQAAAEISEIAQGLKEKAYSVVKLKPSTADEVAKALGLSILAMRPRLTELFRLNMIEDSGERRKNDSGRNAIVWRLRE